MAANLLTISFLISLLTISVTDDDNSFNYVKSLNPKSLKHRKEKLSHFRFYWHDIYSGKNPTAVAIIQPPTNASLTGFGPVSMIDDPLTETPQLSSKLIGRAQGFYGSACQEEVGLLMAMNFAFLEGKYNGSTITLLGGIRNKSFPTLFTPLPLANASCQLVNQTNIVQVSKCDRWHTIVIHNCGIEDLIPCNEG